MDDCRTYKCQTNLEIRWFMNTDFRLSPQQQIPDISFTLQLPAEGYKMGTWPFELNRSF